MTLYFVRVDGTEKIVIARQDADMLYRDTFAKETGKLEIVERVPATVVNACIDGTKILNMARAMGLKRER